MSDPCHKNMTINRMCCSISPFDIFRKELTIVGVLINQFSFPQALSLIEAMGSRYVAEYVCFASLTNIGLLICVFLFFFFTNHYS
jgi:hypothetical protein